MSQSKTLKDIGGDFDYKLTFILHINNVISDSFSVLSFAIRNRKDF